MVYRVICMIKIFPCIIQCLPIGAASHRGGRVQSWNFKGCIVAHLEEKPLMTGTLNRVKTRSL